jgi:hypothetical protein
MFGSLVGSVALKDVRCVYRQGDMRLSVERHVGQRRTRTATPAEPKTSMWVGVSSSLNIIMCP